MPWLICLLTNAEATSSDTDVTGMPIAVAISCLTAASIISWVTLEAGMPMAAEIFSATAALNWFKPTW